MRVHIISFDIPYPANYGGVIDVFHKIRCLKEQGVDVILHCFQYGNRKPSDELEKYCEKVYYYKRDTAFINQLSFTPFNVKSRVNKELKANLLKDNSPIIFEVLHSCYLLKDKDFTYRKKIYRHSNIEHEYFLELAKAEKSFSKKIYLKTEAFKLKRFEKQIAQANVILSVSKKDLYYFKQHYPKVPSYYLPSFHEFDEVTSQTGKGDYILYHGNLGVSENYRAAEWLIHNVFSKINYPVIIAGLNPPAHLFDIIKPYAHIKIIANCSQQDMQSLIANAQIHCLYTEQETGLKLKLLNVLFSGRFVVANTNMLAGTPLARAVEIASKPEEFIQDIHKLLAENFSQEHIEKRKMILSPMSNSVKTKQLMDILFDKSSI